MIEGISHMEDSSRKLEVLDRLNEPVVDVYGTGYFNYLVSLKMVDDNSFLDENGVPTWVDYSKIDWKCLAKEINELIADEIPKSMKVFVGDEPINIIDGSVEKTWNKPSTIGERVSYVYKNLVPEDYRASVINISQHRDSLHPHCTLYEKSPPVAGFFISMKGKLMQVFDYEGDFTHLFGHSPVCGINVPLDERLLKMKPAQNELMEIINRHLGFAYSHDCVLLQLGWKPIPGRK
jgi:hypothetical protein